MLGQPLAGVLMLGDGSYEDGTLAQYQSFYDPTWGRFKSITHPATGNHEYQTPDAQGYFQYFGAAAGDPRLGYYSYDIGTWHMIVLNSNCYKFAGGCGANTAQVKWLHNDLATHPNACTLAYWHHPHFTSGFSADDNGGHNVTTAFWNELYNAGADVVLNGHDHDYERFARGRARPRLRRPRVRGRHRRALALELPFADAQQRGAQRRHLRGAVPDAPPRVVRLEVRFDPGKHVHRLRVRLLPRGAERAALADERSGAPPVAHGRVQGHAQLFRALPKPHSGDDHDRPPQAPQHSCTAYAFRRDAVQRPG
jgi:hypothetical protein